MLMIHELLVPVPSTVPPPKNFKVKITASRSSLALFVVVEWSELSKDFVEVTKLRGQEVVGSFQSYFPRKGD